MKDSYYGYRYLSNIALNEIPLIQINAPGCRTCESLLATGYGIENADCNELKEIRNRINADFLDLETSILDLSPVLKLLESGLYVIADMMCYRKNGEGNFFWNICNRLIEECLNNLVDENINKMKYIIFVLDNKKDPRVKNIALRCAKQLNYCKLKVQIFKVLNRIKDDEEIEQFFIDYLIEDNDTHSLLAKIANSYWD